MKENISILTKFIFSWAPIYGMQIGFNTKMVTSYYWNDYEPTLPMLDWGSAAHICTSKLLVVQVRPGLWQCPITNVLAVRHCLWSLGPLGTHFNEILIKIKKNLSMKCMWKYHQTSDISQYLAACHEPVGSYDKTTWAAICFWSWNARSSNLCSIYQHCCILAHQ